MKFTIPRIFFRFLKYTGIGLAVILLLMFLLPYLFPTYVSNKIKAWANSSITTELNFSKARLSFFNHFPSLTLSLYDVTLMGSEPFGKDTLVAGKELALGVNLLSVFGKTIKIDEIYITNGKLNVLVNKAGLPNYNVYKATETSPKQNVADTASANLKLERIQIQDCELVYHDQSIPIEIDAKKLNYIGKGDLSKAIFDLSSNLNMQGFDISYDHQTYLKNKNLHAKLITQINTNSLALIFEKNDLMINQLPVQFQGKFNFLKDGYQMDFNVKTEATDFKNLFTALPPVAVQWVDKTTVLGNVQLDASLKGDYIAAKKTMPDLAFNMLVEKGSVAAKGLTEPVENIFLNFHFLLPKLNTEEMTVKIDSMHASMGKDELSLVLQTKGMSAPSITGKIDAHADLEKWNKTMNINNTVELKGLLQIKGTVNGDFQPKNKKFPVTGVSMQLKDGFIKTGYYPTPITQINVDADIFNTTGTTSGLTINIKPISLNFEGQTFRVASDMKNFDNLAYTISSKGVLNIGKIYKLFAIDGYDVSGTVETDLSLQGTQADAMAHRYDKLHNKGNMKLHNIKLSSRSFPKPFIVQSGSLHFKDDQLIADKLLMNYGSSYLNLNGYVKNIINYALKDDAMLEGKWNLQTKHLLIDELMAFATDSSNTKSNKTAPAATGVVVIPSNLNMAFTANADKISYNGLDLKNAQSEAIVQNGKLTISKAAFTIIDAPVNMTASYASLNQRRANFDYHITAAEFDIAKAYKEIKLFREMASAAGKASGTVSLDYNLSGVLNDSMYPIFPTLKGGGVLSLKKIKVKGLKLFSAISKETGKEGIQNPDLSKVDIKTKINRNIITIERVKMRVAGFRPRFEGQVSFDGRLNLKARLGLPPLGIFGIPLSITGTQEKPIVKLRRGKASDELQETDADDEKQ